MHIEHNILRYYLRNVWFITGTAYAGKSTAVRMLAERYDAYANSGFFTVIREMTAQIPEKRCANASQSISDLFHPRVRIYSDSLGA